jgi:hypothetical protein
MTTRKQRQSTDSKQIKGAPLDLFEVWNFLSFGVCRLPIFLGCFAGRT